MQRMMKSHVRDCEHFVRTLQERLATCLPCARGATRPPPPVTEAAVTKAAAPRETHASRKGRELKELLQKVTKLRSVRKIKEANSLLASAAPGKSSDALAKKRAQQLRSKLFSFGGIELTRSVLNKFLKQCEVRMLLPHLVKKAQREAAEAATATARSGFPLLARDPRRLPTG